MHKCCWWEYNIPELLLLYEDGVRPLWRDQHSPSVSSPNVSRSLPPRLVPCSGQKRGEDVNLSQDWAGLSLTGKLPPGHSWVEFFFFFLAVLGSCQSVSCFCWVNGLGISVWRIFTHTKHQATVTWQWSLASSCTFWQVLTLLGEAIFVLLVCGRKWLL